jgi:hypothetical protein
MDLNFEAVPEAHKAKYGLVAEFARPGVPVAGLQ